MNIQLKIRGFNISPQVRESFEKELEQLQTQISISNAVAVLEQQRDSAPPFRVHVLLAVPGPDIHAAGCDHTLRAAWLKVLGDLQKQIEHRKKRLKEDRSPFMTRKLVARA